MSKKDSSDSMVRPTLSQNSLHVVIFSFKKIYYQICKEIPKSTFENLESNISSSIDTYSLYHQSNCFERWENTSNVFTNRRQNKLRRWCDHFRFNFHKPILLFYNLNQTEVLRITKGWFLTPIPSSSSSLKYFSIVPPPDLLWQNKLYT